MSRLDDYASNMAAGMSQGVGDIARGAVADIGNSYQDILTSGATVNPSHHATTQTMENVTVDMERAEPAPALAADPAPQVPERHIDIE